MLYIWGILNYTIWHQLFCNTVQCTCHDCKQRENCTHVTNIYYHFTNYQLFLLLTLLAWQVTTCHLSHLPSLGYTERIIASLSQIHFKLMHVLQRVCYLSSALHFLPHLRESISCVIRIWRKNATLCEYTKVCYFITLHQFITSSHLNIFLPGVTCLYKNS